MARVFAATGRLENADGTPSATTQPAGFPIILSVFIRAGVDVQRAAIAINVVCIAVTVALTYLLALRCLRSRTLSTIVAGIVGLSASTLSVYSMMWTESLFTLTCVCALLLALRTLDVGAHWSRILVAGGMVAVASSIRLIGIALIPVVLAFALLREPGARPPGRLSLGAMAGFASSIGLIMFVVRDLVLGLGPVGQRIPHTSSSMGTVLVDSLAAVERQFLPSGPWPVTANLVAAAAILVLVVYSLLRVGATRRPELIATAGFVVTYLILLWVSEVATNVDPVSARLTMPVFPALAILVAFAVRELSHQLSRSRTIPFTSVRYGLSGVLVIVLSCQVFIGWQDVSVAHELGIGYNALVFRGSRLLSAVSRLPPGTKIASNEPYATGWVTHRAPILEWPRFGYYWPRSATELAEASLVSAVKSHGSAYVALFYAEDWRSLSPSKLEADGVQLQVVDAYSDGILYEAESPNLN